MISPADRAELEAIANTAAIPEDITTPQDPETERLRRTCVYLREERDYVLNVLRVRGDTVEAMMDLVKRTREFDRAARVRIQELEQQVAQLQGELAKAKLNAPRERMTEAEHNAFPLGRWNLGK